MTSYQGLLNKLETFFNNHLQVKKFGGEFREQMPNFSTVDERYPLVYVVPTSETSGMNTNVFSLDVYCVDIIQKDRANINTILSDTQLILNDLYLYYTDGSDLSIEVTIPPTMTPINNQDLDYVAGWVGSFMFEVDQYSVCAIPIEPISPFNPTCEDGIVSNSDHSYIASVASGGELQLPDIKIEVKDQNDNLLSTGNYPSVQDETISVFIEPCADASYKFTDSAGTTLYEGTIPSGGHVEGSINDSFVSNSNDTYTASVLAEGSLELPDVTFSINNTLGTQVLSSTIPSVTNQTLIAPDGAVHIKHEADGTIAVVSTPSGVQTDYIIQNNDITVNAANPFIIHAEEPLDIKLKNQNGNLITPSSVTYDGNQHYVNIAINTASFIPVGATLNRTGQTTSYATGDDGWTQRGRDTNFLTLASNNPFGNTNRFTNKTGGQTYTNSVALDWSTYNGSTVLAYYFGDATTRNWGTQLIQYKNSTLDGLKGWDLFNFYEAVNIMNFNFPSGYLYNYAPFNLTRRYMWVSTNQTGGTAISTETAGPNPFTTSPKTSALWGIWVRVCTVTGTTIS